MKKKKRDDVGRVSCGLNPSLLYNRTYLRLGHSLDKLMLLLSKISLHAHVKLMIEQIHMAFVGHPKTSEERATDLIDIADDDRGEINVLKWRLP